MASILEIFALLVPAFVAVDLRLIWGKGAVS